MGGRVLTLDAICNAAFYFAGEWSPALKRNQSRDLLRHVLCRLHGASKGQLFHARLRASHASLAHAVGLSREWVCKLSGRLVAAGWIEYTALRLPDGTYEIGVFRPGRMLKRLLCMLLGYRKSKRRVNDFSHSFPLPEIEREKSFSYTQKRRLEREQEPPAERILEKIPILRQWLGRGNEESI
jgi:Crp-like helix-turn-helix domain